MAHDVESYIRPAKLMPGDRVRIVSPASTPSRESVDKAIASLEALGLVAECGSHVFDELGYLAGTDQDRLADLNEALRDPEVKAVVASRGGKGAYRIADGLDVAAARRNPKLLIGFSEITILHLALWKHCRLIGLHGAPWNADECGAESAESFRRAVTTTEPITVKARQSEPTSELTTDGQANGVLLGGNQDLIATAAGWTLPNLTGAILLIEGSPLDRVGNRE